MMPAMPSAMISTIRYRRRLIDRSKKGNLNPLSATLDLHAADGIRRRGGRHQGKVSALTNP
jgi:hypothetical protein